MPACLRPPHTAPAPARQRGFTLVELLVALFALSIVAILSWRGLDAMVRAQSQLQSRADQVLTLQIALAQWTADLDAIELLPQVTPLEWNGRVLRLVRRSAALGPEGADGVVVAAWAQQSIDGRDTWLRWQSPPVVRRDQLEQAWLQAEAWARDPADTGRAGQVPVMPIERWTLRYFRDNAWREPDAPPSPDAAPPTASRPLPAASVSASASASGSGSTPPSPIPEGIRLILTLPPDGPAAGTLTLDWVSARARVRTGVSPL